MLKENSSLREIARKLEAFSTTASNEARLNRVFYKPRALIAKAQSRCFRLASLVLPANLLESSGVRTIRQTMRS